jgi:hypothetical protein
MRFWASQLRSQYSVWITQEYLCKCQPLSLTSIQQLLSLSPTPTFHDVMLQVFSQVFVTLWALLYYSILLILFTVAYVVHHALDIPDQDNNILHLFTQCNEITEAVNSECLIPSMTAVIKLAKIITVHFICPIFFTTWCIQSQFSHT